MRIVPRRRGLVGCGAVLAVVLVGCSNDAGPVVQVSPAALYGQMCARCHGDDGRGHPDIKSIMPVRDLTSAEVKSQSAEGLERVIMAGRNQMPAFGEMLTPRKIQALVGHIRRLGDK